MRSRTRSIYQSRVLFDPTARSDSRYIFDTSSPYIDGATLLEASPTRFPLLQHSLNTWASMMDQETLGTFSQDERKRQEAIYELIQTEQTYLRDLQLIIEVFYGPLQSILSSAEQ